jgi:CBS domain-containing protein
VVGKSSSSLAVSEIMTEAAKLRVVGPHDTVVEVMELMIDNNFRHVPVVR